MGWFCVVIVVVLFCFSYYFGVVTCLFDMWLVGYADLL